MAVASGGFGVGTGGLEVAEGCAVRCYCCGRSRVRAVMDLRIDMSDEHFFFCCGVERVFDLVRCYEKEMRGEKTVENMVS